MLRKAVPKWFAYLRPRHWLGCLWLGCISAGWLGTSSLRADEATALRWLKALGAKVTPETEPADQPTTGLSLSGAQITDAVIDWVVELEDLESLEIKDAAITNAGLKRLAMLGQLKQLSLYGGSINDEGLMALKGLSQLESLDLRRTPAFTSQPLEPLKLPGLRRLTISTSSQLHLEMVSELRSLEELVVFGFPGRSTESIVLAKLKPLEKLTTLRLILLPETVLDGLDQLPSVTTLDLWAIGWSSANSAHKLTETGMTHIKAATNLRALLLQGRQIDPPAVQMLGQLTQLQRLDLKASNIEALDLVQLKGMTGLAALDLDGTYATEQSVSQLRTALPSTGITFHFPKESAESRAARQALGKLGGMFSSAVRGDTGQASVSLVSLAGRGVADEDLVHLRAFTELSSVDLSRTRVTDRGIEILVTLHGLSTLKLNRTQVTAAGIEQLSQLTGLKTLELGGLPITDQALAKLQTLKRLSKLTISRNMASAKSIAELQAALPDLVLTMQ